MPTTSIANFLTLTNVGSISATWTAPESCATGSEWWKNGPHFVGRARELPGGRGTVYGIDGGVVGSCDLYLENPWHPECYPNGDGLADVGRMNLERQLATAQAYHSPASVCPSGWTTAGVAAMGGGTPSIEGAFLPQLTPDPSDWDESSSTFLTTPTHPSANWRLNMITSALGPQETAVACCPSGWTQAGDAMQCMTVLNATEVASSTACRLEVKDISENYEEYIHRHSVTTVTETWSYDGVVQTQTSELGAMRSGWLDFHYDLVEYELDENGMPAEADSDPSWVLVARQSMLVLVHGGNDNGGSNSSAGDGNGDGDGDSEDGDGEDQPASATMAAGASLWITGCSLLAALVAVAAL